MFQGACYGDAPVGWPGEALQEGQCVIQTLDDLFRVSVSTLAFGGTLDAGVFMLSNLYLLRQVNEERSGGGFATLVQSTSAFLYLHRLTLDGGRVGLGQTLERGRGLHSLSSVTLAEGMMKLPFLQR